MQIWEVFQHFLHFFSIQRISFVAELDLGELPRANSFKLNKVVCYLPGIFKGLSAVTIRSLCTGHHGGLRNLQSQQSRHATREHKYRGERHEFQCPLSLHAIKNLLLQLNFTMMTTIDFALMQNMPHILTVVPKYSHSLFTSPFYDFPTIEAAVMRCTYTSLLPQMQCRLQMWRKAVFFVMSMCNARISLSSVRLVVTAANDLWGTFETQECHWTKRHSLCFCTTKLPELKPDALNAMFHLHWGVVVPHTHCSVHINSAMF